jgi:UDP-N-acetylglucosamine 2-epimerase (non-hydrolysing)
MFTVLTVVGTRPEAIKMAPIIRQLTTHADIVKAIVCSTGQHREMLDQVFHLFCITPDYELDVMQTNQSLSGLTARLFRQLDRVIGTVKPDWVLAQGDTTTVFAAAMVAFYHRVKFGHVEAGLRTGDRDNPFPEEVNRRIADLVADVYFAPTERARTALLQEGCRDKDIHVTGNTVIDAVRAAAARKYSWESGPLAAIPAVGPLVLVTAHRRESFGEPLRDLCRAVRDLAGTFPNIRFVYPVHLNPNVQAPALEILGALDNVSLLAPLDYLSMVNLMKRSILILTDSGGIQEEAPGLGVPVLVLRETTERPEGVEAGGLVRPHFNSRPSESLRDGPRLSRSFQGGRRADLS